MHLYVYHLFILCGGTGPPSPTLRWYWANVPDSAVVLGQRARLCGGTGPPRPTLRWYWAAVPDSAVVLVRRARLCGGTGPPCPTLRWYWAAVPDSAVSLTVWCHCWLLRSHCVGAAKSLLTRGGGGVNFKKLSNLPFPLQNKERTKIYKATNKAYEIYV
jgi:hypothetical protein